MTPFDMAFSRTVGLEGGYCCNAQDLGGATNFGITERTAKTYGFTRPIETMQIAEAKDIYHAMYWQALKLDLIAHTSPLVAAEVFDTAVNMGAGRAVEMLQVSLNALNHGGTLYADIAEDGTLGQQTADALAAYLIARKADAEPVLLKALNCLQGARYIEISRARAANESFVFGWLRNRVGA